MQSLLQADDADKPTYSAILAYSTNTNLLNGTLYEALREPTYSIGNLQYALTLF